MGWVDMSGMIKKLRKGEAIGGEVEGMGFVMDPREAGDICEHPEWWGMHSYVNW
jgi:hypothetical protein